MKNESVLINSVKYKVRFLKKPDKFMKKHNYCGYVKYGKKEIYVLMKNNKIKDTYCHELVHAYLYEIGMENLNADDQTVEVIAMAVMKIGKLLQKNLIKGE